MAFPSDWGRKCELKIQNGQVPGNLSNFPVLLTKDTLPSEMFTSAGSYPALEGGGAIRFSSDSIGANRLACEIVAFSLDDGTDEAEIWVDVPSVSSSTDTSIWIWYSKSGESQPAEDAAYGKHATWDSNYICVQHLQEDPSGSAPQAIDSTSNNHDGTANSLVSGDLVTGAFENGTRGKSWTFDGSNEYCALSSSSVFDALSAGATIAAWAKFDAAGDEHGIWGAGDSGTDRIYLKAETNSGYFRLFNDIDNAGNGDNGGTPSVGTWHHTAVTVDATTWQGFIDGSLTTINEDMGNNFSNLDAVSPFFIGCQINNGGNPANAIEGPMDEYRVSDIARSANWIATCYNNQDVPSTFVLEQTPESPFAILIAAISTFLADVSVAETEEGQTEALDLLIAASSTLQALFARQQAFNASIVGTSTFISEATRQRSIESSIASLSTFLAEFARSRSIDAAIAGTSTFINEFAIGRSFNASIAGTSTFLNEFARARSLETTIAATSTFIHELARRRDIDLSIDALSTFLSDVTVTSDAGQAEALAVLIAGTSTFINELARQRGMDVSISAVSTFLNTLASQTAFTTTIPGVSTFLSDVTVTVEGGEAEALDLLITAVSTFSALLKRQISIDTTIAGTTTVDMALANSLALQLLTGGTATFVPEFARARSLDTTITSSSTFAAALKRTVGLLSSIASQSTFAADIKRTIGTNVLIAAQSTFGSNLNAIYDLAVQIDSQSTLSAVISRLRQLAAQIDAVGGFVVDVTVTGGAVVVEILTLQSGITKVVVDTSAITKVTSLASAIDKILSKNSSI
jgi:hypothetical protein